MALRLNQDLTEMSIRNLSEGKDGQLALKACNLSNISEPIVQKIWEPQHLTKPTGLRSLLKGLFCTCFYAFFV
jgi:hypothetical protein